MGIGSIGIHKECPAIPMWEEGLPPRDVCQGLRVDANMVMQLLYPGAEVGKKRRPAGTARAAKLKEPIRESRWSCANEATCRAQFGALRVLFQASESVAGLSVIITIT